MGGVANFDEAKNVLSVTANVQTVPMEEHMKYLFNGKMFGLNWDQLQGMVTIE
jgi:hypothetical protein